MLMAEESPQTIVRELKRQVEDMEDRVKEIEEVLEGSKRWDRAGLVAEARELRTRQSDLGGLIEAIKDDQKQSQQAQELREKEAEKIRKAREKKQDRFANVMYSLMATTVGGLILLFVGVYVNGLGGP